MASFSSTNFSPPRDWQAFERHSLVLFRSFLKDIGAQINGRGGQKQDGVDIFGREDGNGNLVGVQCKGKDKNYGKEVSEKELRKEVENTKKFEPKLNKFFLITTAEDDAKIQRIANKITEELKDTDYPLQVYVLGWGQLQNLISQYPEAIRAFNPDASPFSDKILNISEKNNDSIQLLLQEFQSIKNTYNTQTADQTSVSREEFDKNIHQEIDNYRDYINSGKPSIALESLTKLKDRLWINASDRIKFRIITNIGASQLKLGHKEKAIECFLEAKKYQPEDKIALSNISYSHILKGEYTEAIDAAKESLLKDYTNKDAASNLILAYSQIDADENPLEFLPAETQQFELVKCTLIHYYRVKGNAIWRNFAKEYETIYPENELLQRYSAEADLDILLSNKGIIFGEKADGLNLENIDHSITKLQIIWEKQKKYENEVVDVDLAHNLAQFYRIKADITSCIRIIEEALQKKPNSQHLLKLLGIIYLEEKKTDEAYKIFEKIKGDPEIILAIAQIMLIKDPDKVNDVLIKLDEFKLDTVQYLTSQQIIIESLIRQKKQEQAVKDAETLVDENQNNIQALCILADTQIKTSQNSDETLFKAKLLISEQTDIFDLFILAQFFEKLGKYNEVVEILKDRLNYKKDTPALRLLFSSMINSDIRKGAYDLFKSLPKEIKDSEFYLRASIYLHIRRGDYKAALISAEKYLKKYPNDLQVAIKWVELNWRFGKDEEIKLFLAKSTEQNYNGFPEDFIRFSNILCRYGYYKNGLDLAYKTILENSDNPDIHLNYVGLILAPLYEGKFDLEADSISDNTYFIIQDSNGKQLTFLIDSKITLSPYNYIVGLDNVYVKNALGLKIGNKFCIVNKEWTVVLIKSKYLFFAYDTMENFETKFPLSQGLEKVTIKSDSENQFVEIFDRVKKRKESIDKLFKQYSENPFPAIMFSSALGVDDLEFKSGLILNGYRFKVCVGTKEERIEALNVIKSNNKNGCVADYITINLIKKLGIKNVINEICGGIYITEATVDFLRVKIEKIRVLNKPYMTLFYKDNRYYREEITQAHLDEGLQLLTDELNWIEQNCSIITAESDYFPSEVCKRAQSYLGINFLDPIIAAHGSKKMLLSDDIGYRQLGKLELKFSESTWLQPVLLEALNTGVIDKKEYSRLSVLLIEEGNTHISIDAEILEYVAIERGEIVFKEVLMRLFDETAEINSHIQVVIEFFRKIWKNSPTIEIQRITGLTLERVFYSKWNIHREDFIEIFGSHINLKFRNYFESWLVGHFI